MQHEPVHVARAEAPVHAAGTSGTVRRPGRAGGARTRVTDVSTALGTDFVGIAAEFGDEERDYLRRTRAFVDDEVLPVINGFLGARRVPARPGAADGRTRPGQRRH
jgi:hypothetical protein